MTLVTQSVSARVFGPVARLFAFCDDVRGITGDSVSDLRSVKLSSPLISQEESLHVVGVLARRPKSVRRGI